MKKITFILFALIAGTAFGQDADATANVDAVIVTPITIKVEDNMSFGSIAADGQAGTVILAANATKAADGSSTASLVTSNRQAALFLVKAASTYGYTIDLPTSATVTNGTETMSITDFTSNLGENSVGTGADQLLYVGGTLNVGATQAEGSYTGDVKVTVAYE
jgi:spore coat protein U-like protein